MEQSKHATLQQEEVTYTCSSGREQTVVLGTTVRVLAPLEKDTKSCWYGRERTAARGMRRLALVLPKEDISNY